MWRMHCFSRQGILQERLQVKYSSSGKRSGSYNNIWRCLSCRSSKTIVYETLGIWCLKFISVRIFRLLFVVSNVNHNDWKNQCFISTSAVFPSHVGRERNRSILLKWLFNFINREGSVVFWNTPEMEVSLFYTSIVLSHLTQKLKSAKIFTCSLCLIK